MPLHDIAIIIPVFNEADNLRLLYDRLKNTLNKMTQNYQLIFVNDGSTDDSLAEILKLSEKDQQVYYINFSRNFGHQVAITAGLNYVDATCSVIMDADLQDPPELIEAMYNKFNEGYDVIYAKRNKREGESFLKKFTAKLYYRLLKRIVAFEIPLDAGDFRLLSHKVVAAIKTMPEQNKFLRGQVAWLGFKQTYVTFDRASRQHGKSTYSYSKMLRFALDGITGFSDQPLLFVSRLGLIISLFSFGLIIYAVFAHFVFEATITGWTSIIISAAFIGGIQLLSIGIIGEYISRINKNVQNRPLYIIDSSNIPNDSIESTSKKR